MLKIMDIATNTRALLFLLAGTAKAIGEHAEIRRREELLRFPVDC